MAKIYGLFGSMTGKLADTVMSVRNGVQVARRYQPMVANPNTEAQVAARARLKLMSQLSAVLGNQIAIPKEGIVSARNMFVKTNYGASTYSEGQADIILTSVQLTKSVVGLPSISASRTERQVRVALQYDDAELSRVVYVILVKGSDGKLRRQVSSVVTTSPNFAYTVELTPDFEYCVFAYGVRDNSDAARAVFGNMQAVTAETVAKLIVTRTLTEADVTVTETRAVVVPAGA